MLTIHILLILFVNTFILYMLRVNIATIILAIAPREPKMVMTAQAVANGEMAWTHREQSYILCAYGFGAALSSIPSVALARKYSSEKIILFSNYGSVLLTILCGFLAFIRDYVSVSTNTILGLLIFFRLFIGIFAGASFPCTFYLISELVPVHWRSRTLLVTLLGSNVGAAVTNVYCGRIIEDFNWYKAFFVSGLVALALLVCWAILITLRPYNTYRKDKEKKTEYDTVPYKEILGSKAVIGLLMLQFTNMYGLYFFLLNWPTFYTYFEDMTITEISDFTAVGFAVRGGGAVVVASLSFYMINGADLTGMQRSLLRKMFVFLSHICPGIIFIIFAAVFIDNHIKKVFNKEQLKEGCRGIYYSSLMLNGAIIETSFINSFELSPNYGPHIFGIVNTLGNLAGFIEPLVFGTITFNDPENHTPWLINFYLIGIFYLIGGLIFIIVGKATPESWNVIRTKGGGLRSVTFPTQRNYFSSLVGPTDSDSSFDSELTDSPKGSISKVSNFTTSKFTGNIVNLFNSTKRHISKAKYFLKNNNVNKDIDKYKEGHSSHETFLNAPSGSSAASTHFKTYANSLTDVASSSTSTVTSSVRQKYQYRPKSSSIIEEDEAQELGETSSKRIRSGTNFGEKDGPQEIEETSRQSIRSGSNFEDNISTKKDEPIITHYAPRARMDKNLKKWNSYKEQSAHKEIISQETKQQYKSREHVTIRTPMESKNKISAKKSKRTYVEINDQQESTQFSSDVQRNDGPSTSQVTEITPILTTTEIYKQKMEANSSIDGGSSQYTELGKNEGTITQSQKSSSDSTVQTTDSKSQRSKGESDTNTTERRKYYLMKKF